MSLRHYQDSRAGRCGFLHLGFGWRPRPRGLNWPCPFGAGRRASGGRSGGQLGQLGQRAGRGKWVSPTICGISPITQSRVFTAGVLLTLVHSQTLQPSSPPGPVLRQYLPRWHHPLHWSLPVRISLPAYLALHFHVSDAFNWELLRSVLDSSQHGLSARDFRKCLRSHQILQGGLGGIACVYMVAVGAYVMPRARLSSLGLGCRKLCVCVGTPKPQRGEAGPSGGN
jgi:hypothetical protein